MDETLKILATFLLLHVICLHQLTNGKDYKPYKVVCYWSSRSAYRSGDGNFDVSNIDPFICTHLIYSFAEMGSSNKLSSSDPKLDLVENNGRGMYEKFISLQKKNHNLTLLLSVREWTAQSPRFSVMARNANSRSVFIQSCVNFLKKYGFHGLDLDLRYPETRGGTTVDDKRNMVLLLQEMKAAFSPHGLIITAAISARRDAIDSAYVLPEMSKSLDFFNVMTYGYHSDSDFKTGHGASLYSRPDDHSAAKDLNVDSTVKYLLLRGVSPDKLVIGLSFYGRTYILKSPNDHSIGAPVEGKGKPGVVTQEAGVLGLSEICMHLSKESGWNVEFENHHKVPFAHRGKQWIAYDDIQSISLKMDYVREKSLAGAMVWSVDMDDFRGKCFGFPYPFLTVLAEDLNGPIRRITEEEDISTTTAPPEKVSTASPDIATTTKRDGAALSCSREGYFRHPKNCKKFYYCQPFQDRFSVVVYNCGPGTFFDERIAACGFKCYPSD